VQLFAGVRCVSYGAQVEAVGPAPLCLDRGLRAQLTYIRAAKLPHLTLGITPPLLQIALSPFKPSLPPCGTIAFLLVLRSLAAAGALGCARALAAVFYCGPRSILAASCPIRLQLWADWHARRAAFKICMPVVLLRFGCAKVPALAFHCAASPTPPQAACAAVKRWLSAQPARLPRVLPC
jgi:hypothetical protein